MATTTTIPDQQSIDTFMSITGSTEPVAIHKLTEHGGNLNEAVNSHFNEGDISIRHEANIAAPLDDFMDIDEPSEIATHRPPFSPLIDNEIAPRIDDVTVTLPEYIPETRGTLSIDDDDFLSLRNSHNTRTIPSAPEVSDSPDYDIEEEMIQAAIEASKREAEIGLPDNAVPHHRQSQSEDPEIAHAVSLSLKSAEQEKAAVGELESEAGPSETRASKLVEEGETLASSNEKLVIGSSSIQDETEDADEQPLVWHRSRHMGPTRPQNVNNPVDAESDLPSEWGGISSEEHDEAVMLEAAVFGGVPEVAENRVPYSRNHYMRNGFNRTGRPYTRSAVRSAIRPPSPTLTAQRLIREQQDDEYLAALQADREKELLEQAAREAAMEEERRKEEDAQRKLEQEQEIERQLAAKETSLPPEPTSDNENGVTLLVRMPDGTRRGRRFLRTDKLQHLFDFIDVGRVIKPTTYRLVRPYPRRAFSDGESDLALNELGLTSKQEALFLELI